MRRITSCLTRTVSAVALVVLAACGGGSSSGGASEPPPLASKAVQVGGTLSGLGAGKSIMLAHVDGAGATVQSAALNANGSYALSLPSGTSYNLRVLTQPVGQTCTVANGSGTASADIHSIRVACADDIVPPQAKTISGSVAGLGVGKTLVLQLSASGTPQEAMVSANGSFQFAEAVAGPYAVSVKTQPINQGCVVAHGQGTTEDAGTALFAITCATSTFKLGGIVVGNTSVVGLRNASNGDSLIAVAGGAFQFAQPVAAGAAYTLTVFEHGVSQVCRVHNGMGNAIADVTDIRVSCEPVVVATPPAPVPVPSVPAGLTMTYDVKSFKLAWGTVTAPVGGGTVSYKLFEDADGAGIAASTQIGGTLTGATYTQVVSGLLHTRLNAQYRVQACNTSGCSTLTAAITPNLVQAIGYFKASNTEMGDRFGQSVAMSSDGSTLAVATLWEASNATGVNGSQADNSAGSAGAVYVYIRTAGAWAQQAYVKASNTNRDRFNTGDRFGTSIALSGDGGTLAVGARAEDSNATGVDGNQANDSYTDSGAAYIYTRTAGVWTQQAYVKASNSWAGIGFGGSVALSGDGSTLAVGALGESSNAIGVNGNQADKSAYQAGAVYVYTRTLGVWVQQAYVKASNTNALNSFGYSLALSGDGSTLAVGAISERSNATGVNGNQVDKSVYQAGAVYVYGRAGGVWAQQAYVKASNTGLVGGKFGVSVALSGDGNALAVGADAEASNATGVNGSQTDISATGSGAVYVYARTAGIWAQQAYIKASNTSAYDAFGSSVALSGDGGTLAVGAPKEDSNASGVNGNQANAGLHDLGAVYIYTRTVGGWVQKAYIKASNAGSGDAFGSSVALSADGSTLAVGAIEEGSIATGVNGNQTDNSAAGAGAVYIY